MLKHFFALIVCLFLANPSAAESVQDQIIRQLSDQGFKEITVSRTLLGRVRIDAKSQSLERELVFNPTTGEILRDYWEQRDDGNPRPTVLNPNAENDSGDDDRSTNTGRRNDDDDDDEDDDDDDDDGDDDDD